MNRKGDKALIVGLDIGTSKVVALVGEYSPGNPIEVIGIGSHESRGLKRGVVVNIESTVQSIQRAVEEAELMAGCEIRSVYASIAGSHVQCRNSHGIVADPRRRSDAAATSTACSKRPRRSRFRPTRRSCTRSRSEYVIDDSQEGIRNPIGMSGVRLEVKAHLVVCAQSAAAEHQQVRAALRLAGRRPDPARALASSDRGADRRRARARRRAGRHRRRHHRPRGVRAGRDPPHRVDPDRRRPGHQRHRAHAAHADAGRRGDQGALRLRAGAAGECRGEHRGAERRRPSAAAAAAPDARRGGAAALRGNLRDGAGGTAPQRLRGASCAPAWC